MATNAELQDRAARAEKRLETAAAERMDILAGQSAAALLRQRLTAERMRALAPTLDALVAVPSALQQATQQLAETRVAVLGAARDDDQREQLQGLMATLDLVDAALEQGTAAATAADNGWRRIPEEDRLALVA